MTLAAATLPFLDPTGPEIPAHEFALLWPELTPTELDLMVTDVAAHGVRNPILLYDDDGTPFYPRRDSSLPCSASRWPTVPLHAVPR